jgi:hypothetical protein
MHGQASMFRRRPGSTQFPFGKPPAEFICTRGIIPSLQDGLVSLLVAVESGLYIEFKDCAQSPLLNRGRVLWISSKFIRVYDLDSINVMAQYSEIWSDWEKEYHT